MWFLWTKTAPSRISSRRRLAAASCNRFLPCLLVVLYMIAAARSKTPASDVRTRLTGDALGLQCPPCERVHCSPRRPSRLRCRGGIVRGVCNCCPVCAKLEGDTCGGKWNYLGRCDVGLYCDVGGLRQPVQHAASKMAPSSQDYKDRNLNWLLKTEGYCRKGCKDIFKYYYYFGRYCYYLRQVNEVNDGDNAFVCVCLSVFLCVCLCVCAQRPVMGVKCHSSKTVKATDFKFDTRVPRDSPDMIDPQKFPQKGAWPWSRDPLNFWALNVNSSKTVRARDFKFDTRVPRNSPGMTPKIFPKTWRL